MAQRTPTRGTIEEEIEETQRQIRRSAQLIQSAFEGLSTLHGRVTEAAALRTQARTASGSSRNQAAATDASGSRSVQSPGRSAMDPGHDAILLSTVLQLPAATDTAVPAVTAPAPSVGPSAASISTLSNLGSDLMTSSESVRSRAGELDELRRAIAMHSLDLRAHAFRELERDRPPRNAPLADTSATAASREVREASENLPPQVVRSRSLAGDSAFQRRFADDPSTSLGVMVTARASLAAARRNAATPTNADEYREAGRASVSSASSSSSHRPSPPSSRPSQSASSSSYSPPPADANAPIPDGIATRFSRLAQEIQQDISRISQQSESLMSWINDNRARIDAGLAAIRPPLSLTLAIPTPPRERTADRSPSPSANRTPRPAHANIAAATAAASVLGLATHVPVATANAFSGATSGAGSDAANLTPRERYVLQLLEAANGGHRRWDAPSSLPPPDANGTPNGPSPSTSMDVLANSTNMPLSPPPPAAPGAEVSTTYLETDYVAALARVRALTRRGPTLNDADESSSEEEPPVRRGHRVRRRLNADGDIVERSVPVRVSRSSFSSWGRTQTPGQQRERSDADEERDPFAQTDNGFISAYERARNGEAYNPAPGSRAVGGTRNRWDGGTPNSRAGMDADGNPLPNTANNDWMNLALRELQRDEEGATSGSGYERNRAAMIARAHVLASSVGAGPGAYTRGLSALPPPPPPPPPPPGTYAVTSTTQNTPGSLWNDSGVRVRIRSGAASRWQDDSDDVLRSTRERVLSQFNAPNNSSAPASASASAAATRRAWPRLHELGAGPSAAEAELEQPVWGSSTPFSPSPLPLPRVEAGSAACMNGGAKKAARMPRRRVLAGR